MITNARAIIAIRLLRYVSNLLVVEVQIQAVTCCILVLHVKRAINVLLIAAWTALLEAAARQAVKCATDLLLIKAV